MNEKPRPTLRAIAARAGVTRATVSLALRDDSRLPRPTRERLQTLAREMGYRPDPVVSTLMTHLRTARPVKHLSTLAFVTSFPTRDGWRKESCVFRESFAGATERAGQLGYRLEEIWAKEKGMTGRRLSQILLARGVRGLVIGPMPASRGHLSLDWPQFVAAALGYSMWKPDLPRAVGDHFQWTLSTLRRLKRLGYRRIGLAMPAFVDERVNHLFTAALLIHQQHVPRSDRIRPLWEKQWDESHVMRWVRETRPDVIMTNEPLLLRWARNGGLRVPQDIGLVSLEWSKDETPTWAGVDQNARTVGAAAVNLVVGRLQRNERGIPPLPEIVHVNGSWVEGGTIQKQ